MKKHSWGVVIAALLTAALALASASVESPSDHAVASPCRAAANLPNPDAPVLDCAAPPNTFDVSSFFAADASAGQKALAGPTWDAWAWSSFAALNWPALVDETQPTGFQRGVPDLGSTFVDAKASDILVWETLKEKRELFQPLDTTGPSKITQKSLWQDLTFAAQQQPKSPINLDGIDACTPADAERFAALRHYRAFSQGAKHPTLREENTFDETVEVASQALEPAKALCAGYSATTTPSYQDCLKIFPENTPAVPNAVDGRTPVGARVWNGNPQDADTTRPIFFEVKVNYDFWQYILERKLYLDEVAGDAAVSTDILSRPKLPFRTSAPTGPGRSENSTYGYDAGTVADRYGHLKNPNALPGIGSLQAKAAWLMLGDEDRSKYHTTEGLFFRTKKGAPVPEPEKDALEDTCYAVAEFGLLGLHIIQRVHAQPFSRQNPNLFAHGGTFIFATWEHIGLGDYQEKTDYFYANYLAFDTPLPLVGPPFPFDVQTTPFPNFASSKNGAIPVVRQMPYPLKTTAAVNKAVHDQLPADSLWRNYRLIGTQFVPMSSEEASMAFNQPHYLANLLVETNDGLQKFQGLPPAVLPTPYFTQKVGIQGTGPAFNRDTPNLIFNREFTQPFNMGGCMGCHGVAQVKGYNFSFVFADGQRGSGLDTQQHFAVAGGQLPAN